MLITDFKIEHIEEAMKLAKSNYEEERQFVTTLPYVNTLPDLTELAENRLGVAAYENNRMIGFLGCYSWYNQTINLKGVFSPIHAHGAVLENRDKIYSKLYGASAEKWVLQGISSHAIALYAHDLKARESFFYNGFGIRCIDAIRPLTDIALMDTIACDYCELEKTETHKILELKNLLINHLSKSPTFCFCKPYTEERLINEGTRRNSRLFVAKQNNQIIAYIEIMNNGENFACDDSGMMNICGACCLPEYRGTGIYNNLLSYLVATLKAERYTHLGVDFESFNPAARGFWLKHFIQYTNSVVRRIDDNILKN